ncbi:gluconate 5-dehydrogenase [Poseidonocella pacifica]|uniref:Gluconate 5-dehydrogenase n=1 Tax=Poseidonocella pacifica TaxID=871651 RepID=A0A1I0XDW8_9RHOB|nr:SDR family NAD(P)-dependent oxidoreductase [Poseidonocella pacifica]SFA99215.1 gluconate 5-dehydrogenase [Poseidonocella pacifica]
MRDWQGKRYWIVGGSEGLGEALAHVLSRVGAEVIISGRTEERLQEVVNALPGRASYTVCDVQDRDSVTSAAMQIGQIDGLVHVAGVYWPMKATEWDAEKAELMADVNFTGAFRVLGQVVPQMTERGEGHIVLTGSLSGSRGLPGAIGYAASKAGVMSLAECLHADLRGTGVDVQLVNPGFVRTRLTDKNDFRMPFLMDAEDAAKVIFEHMNGEGFSRSFPTTFAWMFRLGRLLPDWLYYRIFA